MVCTDANRLEKKPTSLPCEGRRTSVLNCEPSTEEAHEWAREGLVLNHTLGAHASAWPHYILLSTCLIRSLRMLYFSQCTLCVLYNEHIQFQDLTQEAQQSRGKPQMTKGWQRKLSSGGKTSWRISARCIRISESKLNHLQSSVKHRSMSVFSEICDGVKWACGFFFLIHRMCRLMYKHLYVYLYPMWSGESSRPRWMLKKELWRQTTWVQIQPPFNQINCRVITYEKTEKHLPYVLCED